MDYSKKDMDKINVLVPKLTVEIKKVDAANEKKHL